MGIHPPTAFTKLVRKRVPRAVLGWRGWGDFRSVGVDFDAIFHACVFRATNEFDSDPVPVRVARYVRPMQLAGCKVVVFTDGSGHKRAKAGEARRRSKLKARAKELHSLKVDAATRIEGLTTDKGAAAGGGGGDEVRRPSTLDQLRDEARAASEASTLVRRELVRLDPPPTPSGRRVTQVEVECPFDCDADELRRIEEVVLREAFGCSREEKLERMRIELQEALQRSAVMLREQAVKAKEALDSREQLSSAEARTESIDALRSSGCEIRESVGEAEIEAAHAMGRGEIDCFAGQDTDLFLGPGKGVFVQHPHSDRLRTAWKLDEVAKGLELTQAQLVDAAQIIGTDFCEGIKGFGAVKAVQQVKKHGSANGVAAACRASAKLAANVPEDFLEQAAMARLVFANQVP